VVLVHFSLMDGRESALGAVLCLLPVALLALWALRRSRRGAALAVAALVAASFALWLGWGLLERHFTDVLFLEHAGVNLVLAIVFGRTLAAGREPLCALFARLLHGEIPPEVARYARQVTVAWTIFFASLFIASCVLYLAGYLTAWSILANIASPALLAAMFVAEYAVRCRVLPSWERTGVLGAFRAFSRHFG
jgi:uncharacterized membrane protein